MDHLQHDHELEPRRCDSIEIVVVPIQEETSKKARCLLEYISLAVSGIPGVLARYGFQKLTGPNVTILYLDLPSNMVGSFLMGWFVVFKGDITNISEELAAALSTGFLGCLTTFSGWNQEMLELIAEGRWLSAVVGIILGLFLAAYSIIFGIETAQGFKWLLGRSNIKSFTCTVVSNKFHCLKTVTVTIVTTLLLTVLGSLWVLFVILGVREFKNGSSEAAELFLSCMVSNFGVWIRRFLARFNGRGLGGKTGEKKLKWMPFGTLAANVLAACVMASLATLKKEFKTTTFNTVATGIQFGLLGSLSTVSTFIAEFHAMRSESAHPWRAYVYVGITFVLSIGLGTLLYAVPVWVLLAKR